MSTVYNLAFLWIPSSNGLLLCIKKARIDIAGALHHIICRSIERGKIFTDEINWNNFVDRIGGILAELETFIIQLRGADEDQ